MEILVVDYLALECLPRTNIQHDTSQVTARSPYDGSNSAWLVPISCLGCLHFHVSKFLDVCLHNSVTRPAKQHQSCGFPASALWIIFSNYFTDQKRPQGEYHWWTTALAKSS